MSHEIKLSNQSQAPGDFWTEGGSALMTPPSAGPANGFGNGGTGPTQVKASPVRRMHRLLRGRYPLAIVLAAAGALTCGVAGYMAIPPKFESDAMVNLNPTVSTGQPEDKIVEMVNMKMAAQTGLIQSTGVAEEALRDHEFVNAWRTAYRAPLPSPADLLLAVDAERVKASPLIKIAFVDQDKKVAQAGAHAITRAYMKLHGGGDNSLKAKIDFDTSTLDVIKREIAYKKKQLDELAEKFGDRDLRVQHDAVEQELVRQTTALHQAKLNYDAAVARRQGGHRWKRPTPTTSTSTSRSPPLVRTCGGFWTRSRTPATSWTRTRTTTSASTARSINATSRRFRRPRKRWTTSGTNFWSAATAVFRTSRRRPPTGASIAVLKQQFDDLQTSVNLQSEQARGIGHQQQQIEDVNAELAVLEQNRGRFQGYIDTMAAQQALTVSVKVEDPGSEGSLDSKKRKLAAAGGFAFGGLLPLGMLLLYGLTENRFRYSEDASSTDMAGVTLLGILPNLPDRLSDPQQAGVAAHCVHQIRTMLQISRSNDEPQVLAVSSASPGDGKTSLTLALGLSYAACGGPDAAGRLRPRRRRSYAPA